MSLTFGEQVKIVLKNRNMTIKELADQIENYTGKPMSRQNLTQKLGRNNFQEQDMRMIAEILNLNFTLDILSGEDIKLPVDKVLEGNMTIDEVLNLESDPQEPAKDSDAFKMMKPKEEAEEERAEEQAELEEVARFAGKNEDDEEKQEMASSSASDSHAGMAGNKKKRRPDEIDSVSFMKKKSTFEEQPIDMYNYRSKKDLFINLGEADQTEKPKKSSDELIADLLREMEEIEREQREQEEETRQRQEKWEQEKKSKGFRSVLSGLFGRGKKKQQEEEIPEIEETQSNAPESGETFLEGTVAESEGANGLETVAESEGANGLETVAESESASGLEIVVESESANGLETVAESESASGLENQEQTEDVEAADDRVAQLRSLDEESVKIEKTTERNPHEDAKEKDSKAEKAEIEESEAGNAEKTESENGESSEEFKESEKEGQTADQANEEPENKEAEILGEINPYTGKEYENNTVRNHKNKIGYVEVYNSEKHAWVAMTEWAFLGFQEKLKVELGKDYKQPFFMD